MRATLFLGNKTLFQKESATRHQRILAAAHVLEVLDDRHGESRLVSGFKDLDSQFKRTSSFLIATAVAKLFCERALRAAWAIRYRHILKVATVQHTVGAGNMRPDIIAYDQQKRWYVVESKGRAGSTGSALSAGKAQATAIAKINGTKPRARLVCGTQLSPRMMIEVRDPPSDDGLEISFELEDFWRSAFDWFLEGPAEDETTQGINRISAVLRQSEGFKFGLAERTWKWARGGYETSPPHFSLVSSRQVSIGLDGSVVWIAG